MQYAPTVTHLSIPLFLPLCAPSQFLLSPYTLSLLSHILPFPLLALLFPFSQLDFHLILSFEVFDNT